jgi:thiamine-phosphate pyrophosphorylase
MPARRAHWPAWSVRNTADPVVHVLYLITDSAVPARIPEAVSCALCAAPPGSVLVQLRAKGCAPQQLYDIALELREVCTVHGAGLVVNDRTDLAQAVGANGVQLPERALPTPVVRQLLGERALIGVSCHDAAGLSAAASGGASFATLSPVYASPGKGKPLGLPQFSALLRGASLPVYALGGVDATHARALKAAGAAGLAVISAVFSSQDPATAVSDLLAAWTDR